MCADNTSTSLATRSVHLRIFDLAIGAALQGVDVVENSVTAVWNLNETIWNKAEQVTEPLRKPLDALGVTDLVRRPVDAVATRVESSLATLEERGRDGLFSSDSFAIQSISQIIDEIVAYLEQSPAVDALIAAQVEKLMPVLARHPAVGSLVREQVTRILPQLVQDATVQSLIRAQAGQYLDYLRANPEQVQALIRQEGDAYIAYLNANPESVQQLVTGQSVGMATEVMDEVRERTVTADSVVEMLVRNILRRKPREQVEAPPPQVQRRAEHARLPSDFLPPSAAQQQQARERIEHDDEAARLERERMARTTSGQGNGYE
jgi:hypothetical protein